MRLSRLCASLYWNQFISTGNFLWLLCIEWRNEYFDVDCQAICLFTFGHHYNDTSGQTILF